MKVYSKGSWDCNEIKSVLIKFANGITEEGISPDLEMCLKDDFTMENLKIQLSMLPDAIKASSLGIKR